MFVRYVITVATACAVAVLITDALNLTGPMALLLGFAIGLVAFLTLTVTEPK